LREDSAGAWALPEDGYGGCVWARIGIGIGNSLL
jgi:hypothetical protein